MSAPIRTLLFSTLYPNSISPNHGIFVETRLRQLLASGGVTTRVVAPVPWFPFRHRVFGEYARHAAVPRREVLHGIAVSHPRFLAVPKIGTSLNPRTLASAGLVAARDLIADGYDFDLLDAHYFFPDGVAAAQIGQTLGKPVVITARGSDINLFPRHRQARKMIVSAAADCAAIITVSAALKAALVELGADETKITVLRNGVDLDLFYPDARHLAASKLGVSGFVLCSVGNLVSNKGHDLAILALTELTDATLLIAGRGSAESALRELAARAGVADRVRFLGRLGQAELRTAYSASDCLVLASEREGWPNVLLEAMACGTPVVATRVGGVPEIVAGPVAGIVIEQRTPSAVADAVRSIRRQAIARDETRAYAQRFGWGPTSEGQLSLFRRLCRVADA